MDECQEFKVKCIEMPTGKSKFIKDTVYKLPLKIGENYNVFDTEIYDDSEYYLLDINVDGVLMLYINAKYFKKI